MTEQDRNLDTGLDDTEGHTRPMKDEDDTEGHTRPMKDEDDTEGHVRPD